MVIEWEARHLENLQTNQKLKKLTCPNNSWTTYSLNNLNLSIYSTFLIG